MERKRSAPTRRQQTKHPQISRLQVIYRPIDSLKLNPRNPRIHNRHQRRQIARSIKTFGFVVPVLIDREGNVICGHGRILAAGDEGLKEVPTIMIEHLSQAQLQAFTIADSRLTENSTWDEHLLAASLKELSELDLDFSLEVTGFSMTEIDLHIEGVNHEPGGTGDVKDILPEDRPGHPVTREGDLWQLRQHRVFCGDALARASYSVLFEREKAAAVFTDVPYNVPINGYVCGKGKTRHSEFKMGSGEMSDAEFTDFLHRACQLMVSYTAPGSLHFHCMDWKHVRELLEAASGPYTELKNICVWVKENAGMGSLYRSQHELVFVFKNGRAPHRNNIELGKHGRYRTNVWRHASVSSFGRATEEGRLSALHPTIKPTQMVVDAILDCTARGDLVLDPFLGSGTTVIAAERTGRRCYGLEIDPIYVDVIVRRWQNHTGDVARLASSSKTFEDVALERGAIDAR